GGAYAFVAFYILLSLLCLAEFFTLAKSKGLQPNRTIGYFAGLVLFLSVAIHFFTDFNSKWLLANILLLFGVFITELYKKSEAPFSNIAYTFLGLIYAVVPFIFYVSLAFISGTYNFHLAL